MRLWRILISFFFLLTGIFHTEDVFLWKQWQELTLTFWVALSTFPRTFKSNISLDLERSVGKIPLFSPHRGGDWVLLRFPNWKRSHRKLKENLGFSLSLHRAHRLSQASQGASKLGDVAATQKWLLSRIPRPPTIEVHSPHPQILGVRAVDGELHFAKADCLPADLFSLRHAAAGRVGLGWGDSCHVFLRALWAR